MADARTRGYTIAMKASSRRAALALLAAAPLAGRAEALDARACLPPPPGPEECRAGPCPSFAAIELAGAALTRQYGPIRGEHLALSDADLFLRRALAGRRTLTAAATALARERRVAEPWELAGGWLKDDLDALLAEGAAARATLPWSSVWKRREEGGTVLAGAPGGLDGQISTPENPQAFLERVRFEEGDKAARPETGETALLRQDRERIRGLLKGFRVKSESFLMNAAVLGPAFYKDPGVCRARGASARDFALSELRAGRPVAFAMNLAGLPEWTPAPGGEPAWRSVLVVGAQTGAAGAAALKTRLPDGSNGPDLNDYQLCRVGQAVSLLAPKDAL